MTGFPWAHAADFEVLGFHERGDPGNRRYTAKNPNKVVEPGDRAFREVAPASYSQTIQHVVPVSSAAAAELVKVFENTFRAVETALVNTGAGAARAGPQHPRPPANPGGDPGGGAPR